jgi:hypothetical protein
VIIATSIVSMQRPAKVALPRKYTLMMAGNLPAAHLNDLSGGAIDSVFQTVDAVDDLYAEGKRCIADPNSTHLNSSALRRLALKEEEHPSVLA